MQFSKRSYVLPASPIRKLEPYLEEALSRGVKVYPLHIGQPDVETPKGYFEALKAYNGKVLSYGRSQGELKLIDKIVEYYNNIKIPLERKDVLITNGGSEALHYAMLIVCDPGDEVIIPEPFYPSYAAFIASALGKIVPITTKAEDGFHLPAKDEIAQLITSRTKAILISNPGNPTGIVYSREELETLADIAIQYNLIIIADEVYREFVYMDSPYTSLGHIGRIRDRVVIVDSISKRYSACGARIGCLVSKNEEFMSLALKYCQSRGCPPLLEQLGAAALYDTPISYIRKVNQEYRERRDLLLEGLKSIPGVMCKKPDGAFYIMAKLPVHDAEKFVIWMLQDFTIDGETISAAPGEGFYATPGLGKSEIRMSYALQKEDLKKAVRILAEALSVYPGRSQA